MVNVIDYSIARDIMTCEPVFLGEFRPCFFVFEKRRVIAGVDNVDMLFATFFLTRVVHVVFIFNIDDCLYDCWLNYYDSEGRGKVTFDALTKSNYAGLYITSRTVDDLNEIFLDLDNQHQKAFKRIAKKIEKNYQPWSMDMFVSTKIQITERYRDKSSLWEAMRSIADSKAKQTGM